MKIILNAVGYVGQSGGAGGAGVFIQHLVAELSRLHSVDVLVASNAKHFQGKAHGARVIEMPYVTAEMLRHLREGPTVVIDPFGALPCYPFPEDLALCVVVHDLMHLERPYFFTHSERQGRTGSFARGLQRADAVVVFSADQARATRQYFPGTAPVVIPHLPYAALVEHALTGPDADVSAYEPFMLFPAVKWPHKNHRTVLAAFAAYVRSTGSKMRLILCGGSCAEDRFSYYPPAASISSQIVDLGLISEVRLRALYEAASAILFPTLYEGFGIPVLEAAYLGKMVVASRLDVFDEILGPDGYRSIDNPLCELRWMRSFAEVESKQRVNYEAATQSTRNKVSLPRFISQFEEVLKHAADRYSHPALYPLRAFRAGDRPTSSVITPLNFEDIHAAATVERGSRNAGLGSKPTTQSSSIFRSADAAGDRRVCLRGRYSVENENLEDGGSFYFSAWVRLLAERGVDALQWSVNDANTADLLPELRDNEWHLIRRAVPPAGFVDFRAHRDGITEAPGVDLEIHDPCIVRVDAMPLPEGAALQRSLTICVADLSGKSGPGAAIAAARKINDVLPFAGSRLQWIIIAPAAPAAGEIGVDIPANVRVHLVDAKSFTRASAAGLVTPYQAIDQILLLDAADLTRCLEQENLEIIRAAVASASWAGSRLALDPVSGGLWADDERGRFMSVAHRIGQPIPFLEREVILECLNAKVTPVQRRFAVIETDLVGSISHHGVVTKLFLDGAQECGFRPVLGLNRRSQTMEAGKGSVDSWTGFGSYVYSVGVADDFTDELAAFIDAKKLGADDLIFMHSLSPQIVLGAARYVASHPETAPTFAMRFFSTAEAMAGHKLSYTKILRSIESVEILRRKMHFFCESENLIAYYDKAIGRRYPLLLNPEHPSLATVRNCTWMDPGIGDLQHPTLAYFGEARAEKGFDFVPTILEDLLADSSIADFHFIVQTGSNSVNRTPEMEQAKAALLALRKAHPGRIRCFESVDTQEQFYFLMKHATGVIAPYRPESYGVRGTGVTLEALQMGLDVFAWVDTDLYATFKHTGRLVGVAKSETFAEAIIRHFREPPKESGTGVLALRQSPEDVCRRLVSLCIPTGSTRESAPVLWVGNDTHGEGCSSVYAAQKLALREIGCDYLELFVPWPDPNLRGVERGLYDEKIYGFASSYNCQGLAWMARPNFGPELNKILGTIEKSGPTYARLRDLNGNMHFPESLQRAIQACDIRHTVLNYAHLYPVISHVVPREQVVIETHDIISYAHAVRRGESVSLTEKVDELSDLRLFPQIVAISADEQREMASACPASEVFWRLPPYVAEATALHIATQVPMLEERPALISIPEAVAQPTPNMLATYYTRPDLQKAFSLGNETGRAEFFRWWLFIGQLEFGGQLDLTPGQCQWLLYPVDDGAGNFGLTGQLQLILSWRADLRAEFMDGASIDVAQLAAWEMQNATREFGFSREDLLAMSERTSSDDIFQTAKPRRALEAVVHAGPMEVRGTFAEIRAQFQIISELDAIDLVLVGSDHPANITSFRWFIKEVFLPHIAPTGKNLFIAGSACRQLGRETHRNIFLLGRCEYVEPLLRASRACPLPVIAGSGSPIKTIPAMAVNGAVTVTDRIEQAFRLSDYGIPSFSHARAFADDVNRLLNDADFRADRVQRSSRYANDVLKVEDYVEFWRKRLGAPAARPKPAVAEASEPVSIVPMIRKTKSRQRR